MRALAEFGAPPSDLTPEDFTNPDLIFQIGVEPSRVDILTNISGVEFDQAWREKKTVTVGNLEVFVLSKADMLKNKLATGGDKDQGDILWLKKNQDDQA